MALNYDSFICTLKMEYGGIWQAEIRHYDAGKETSDGGKGKYQQWTHDTQVNPRNGELLTYHSFQSELFEAGWKWYYSSLSDSDKQKYMDQCNLRASQQQNVKIRKVPLEIVKPRPGKNMTNLRPTSELLSGLQGLC